MKAAIPNSTSLASPNAKTTPISSIAFLNGLSSTTNSSNNNPNTTITQPPTQQGRRIPSPVRALAQSKPNTLSKKSLFLDQQTSPKAAAITTAIVANSPSKQGFTPSKPTPSFEELSNNIRRSKSFAILSKSEAPQTSSSTSTAQPQQQVTQGHNSQQQQQQTITPSRVFSPKSAIRSIDGNAHIQSKDSHQTNPMNKGASKIQQDSILTSLNSILKNQFPSSSKQQSTALPTQDAAAPTSTTTTGAKTPTASSHQPGHKRTQSSTLNNFTTGNGVISFDSSSNTAANTLNNAITPVAASLTSQNSSAKPSNLTSMLNASKTQLLSTKPTSSSSKNLLPKSDSSHQNGSSSIHHNPLLLQFDHNARKTFAASSQSPSTSLLHGIQANKLSQSQGNTINSLESSSLLRNLTTTKNNSNIITSPNHNNITVNNTINGILPAQGQQNLTRSLLFKNSNNNTIDLKNFSEVLSKPQKQHGSTATAASEDKDKLPRLDSVSPPSHQSQFSSIGSLSQSQASSKERSKQTNLVFQMLRNASGGPETKHLFLQGAPKEAGFLQSHISPNSRTDSKIPSGLQSNINTSVPTDASQMSTSSNFAKTGSKINFNVSIKNLNLHTPHPNNSTQNPTKSNNNNNIDNNNNNNYNNLKVEQEPQNDNQIKPEQQLHHILISRTHQRKPTQMVNISDLRNSVDNSLQNSRLLQPQQQQPQDNRPPSNQNSPSKAPIQQGSSQKDSNPNKPLFQDSKGFSSRFSSQQGQIIGSLLKSNPTNSSSLLLNNHIHNLIGSALPSSSTAANQAHQNLSLSTIPSRNVQLIGGTLPHSSNLSNSMITNTTSTTTNNSIPNVNVTSKQDSRNSSRQRQRSSSKEKHPMFQLNSKQESTTSTTTATTPTSISTVRTILPKQTISQVDTTSKYANPLGRTLQSSNSNFQLLTSPSSLHLLPSQLNQPKQHTQLLAPSPTVSASQSIANSRRSSKSHIGATSTSPASSIDFQSLTKKQQHQQSLGILDTCLAQSLPNSQPPTPGIQTQSLAKPFVSSHAVRSRAGALPGKPTKTNQDSYIIQPNFNKNKFAYFFSVCDGHGQHGHLVSQLVKKSLGPNIEGYLKPPSSTTTILNQKETKNEITSAMESGFLKTSLNLQESGIDLTFSGSTCVGVYVTGSKYVCANIGDSRAIVGRFDSVRNEWSNLPLSIDHKPDLPTEKQRILASGGRVDPYFDDDGEAVGPARVWMKNENIPGLAMARSFGDFVASSVGVICEPEVLHFDVTPNDKFIAVASDGIWEFLSNEDVVKLVAPFYMRNDPDGACERLVKEATAAWKREDDVIDDITVIIAFFNK